MSVMKKGNKRLMTSMMRSHESQIQESDSQLWLITNALSIHENFLEFMD